MTKHLTLEWSLANSGKEYGSVGWSLKDVGWEGFINAQVIPALDWCDATDVTPTILIHHAFGQYFDPMHLDAWDYAYASGYSWLTQQFREAWKTLIGTRCKYFAYVGGVQLLPRLTTLPWNELNQLITRNLRPYQRAGFSGVYVDAAENAIAHAHVGVNEAQSCPRSLDQLLLAHADRMFPEPAGIEAAPRSFSIFEPLWGRNLVLQDSTWLSRYDPELRHGSWDALGYHREVLTGTVWRTIPFNDSSAVEKAVAIAEDDCIAAVSPGPLIDDDVEASDLFPEGD